MRRHLVSRVQEGGHDIHAGYRSRLLDAVPTRYDADLDRKNELATRVTEVVRVRDVVETLEQVPDEELYEIQASGGPHQVENHVASAPKVGFDDVRRAGVVEDHFGVQQPAVDAQRFNTRDRGVHDASTVDELKRRRVKVSGFDSADGGLGRHSVPRGARTHDQGFDTEFPAALALFRQVAFDLARTSIEPRLQLTGRTVERHACAGAAIDRFQHNLRRRSRTRPLDPAVDNDTVSHGTEAGGVEAGAHRGLVDRAMRHLRTRKAKSQLLRYQRPEFDSLVVEAEHAVESGFGRCLNHPVRQCDTVVAFVVRDVDDPRVFVGSEHRLRCPRLDQCQFGSESTGDLVNRCDATDHKQVRHAADPLAPTTISALAPIGSRRCPARASVSSRLMPEKSFMSTSATSSISAVSTSPTRSRSRSSRRRPSG